MSAAPRGAARPRGRPVKGDEPAPTSDIMLAAAEAFSLHGYNGISLRTLNDQLGVSHNLLYNRLPRLGPAGPKGAVVSDHVGRRRQWLLIPLMAASFPPVRRVRPADGAGMCWGSWGWPS